MSRRATPLSRLHEAVFRGLLVLSPRAFRRAHGEEMLELFRHRLARARASGWRRVARLWLHTAADLVVTGFALRRQPPHGGREEWMNGILDDLRLATRRLLKTPLFTTSAVLILALGMGANAAAFSFVDTLLFRPPPFARPDELVHIFQDSDRGEPGLTSFPAYRDMTALADVFAGVSAVSGEILVWETADGPVPVAAEYATASTFPVLGLQPSRGRWFGPEHDRVGAGAWAVVSHRTWLLDMGGDPGVLGSTIRLNGQPVTVIGVGPETFHGSRAGLTSDFWLSISSSPLSGAHRVELLERRQDHWYDVFARLAPGVTLAQARSALDALALRMGQAHPDVDRGRGLTVFALKDVRVDPFVDRMLFAVGTVVLTVVGLVLLLACSNLANLLLVRGIARAPEVALRQALGAGRGRIARLFLLEAVLLATVGGAAGLLAGRGVVALLPRLPIPVAPGTALHVTMDARVLAFMALLVLLTSVFFGLAPSLRVGRTHVATTLREDVRSASHGMRHSRLRDLLVAVQVAVSLVLLIGAGLLGKSLAKVRGEPVGIDVGQLAVLGTNPLQGGVPPEEREAVMDAVLARVQALPGVRSAALTSRLPVSRGGSTTTVVEGYQPAAGTGTVELAFAVVGEGYLETAGIPLVAGRGFGAQDGPDAPTVVLVNETAARRFWGGDALGKRMRPEAAPDGWREVVGVVADVKVRNLGEPPSPMIFLLAGQGQSACCNVLVRVDGDPRSVLPGLRGALRDVRPSLPVSTLATFEAHVASGLGELRAAASLMGLFSVLAIVLATLGIYAVVSFAVAGRAAEVGIRIALGAERSRIVRMVVGEALGTVALGLAAGAALAMLAAPALRALLFEVSAVDPSTFVGGVLLLGAVAAAASWVPAWRASRADPVEVLRAR